jgi:hypothetical protein
VRDRNENANGEPAGTLYTYGDNEINLNAEDEVGTAPTAISDRVLAVFLL